MVITIQGIGRVRNNWEMYADDRSRQTVVMVMLSDGLELRT